MVVESVTFKEICTVTVTICFNWTTCSSSPVDQSRPVGSVGWVPDYRAGGRRFEPRPDQHLGSLNNWGESAAFVMTSVIERLDFLVFSDKDDKP